LHHQIHQLLAAAAVKLQIEGEETVVLVNSLPLDALQTMISDASDGHRSRDITSLA
jgi:hypothetical protein